MFAKRVDDKIVSVTAVQQGEHTEEISEASQDYIDFIKEQERAAQVVTMAQARKAMYLSNITTAQVDSAIEAITDPDEKELAKIDWNTSPTVRRNSTLVATLAPALGLTEQQIDALFALAETL